MTHVTLVREMDTGRVHLLDRDGGDLPAIYGSALPLLLAGRTIRIGNTRHFSVTAAAERSMG